MPSSEVLILAVLLVIQQVLHARERQTLLDRLGAPAPPSRAPAPPIRQKTALQVLKRAGAPEEVDDN